MEELLCCVCPAPHPPSLLGSVWAGLPQHQEESSETFQLWHQHSSLNSRFLSTARHLLLKQRAGLVPHLPGALLCPPSGATSLWSTAGTRGATHHHDVAGSVLDGAEQPQDDDDDVQEVGQDRGPLVSQEVKHLPL